jgi:hypothetical protein
MIVDENVLILGKRLDDGKKPTKEMYAGKFYDEPVTIVYNQIRNIETNRANWHLLSSNLKPYPCVIVLKGYKTQSIGGADLLIKVFEEFRYTVKQLTEKPKWKWTETQLLKTLVELTNNCYLIERSTGNVNELQCLCPGRLLVTSEGQVKLPMLKKSCKKQVKLQPYLPRDGRFPNSSGWAPYALGATILHMALGPNFRLDVPLEAQLSAITSTHPVLHSLLKLYICQDSEQYSFEQLRVRVSLGSCYALVRMNQLTDRKQLRVKERECAKLLQKLGTELEQVVPVRLQREKKIIDECPSCLQRRDISSEVYAYRCVCGAINLTPRS